MMVDYLIAVKRPFTDFKKFSIGCLLYLIPFVNIITQFFVSGYVLLCAKRAYEGNFELPEWENWGELFLVGVLMTVITIVYLIPMILVGGIGGLFQEMISGTSILTFRSPVNIISLILGLMALYLLPAAYLSYAEMGKFSAGFNLMKILRKSIHVKYLTAWVLVLVYTLVVGAIAAVLGFIFDFTFVVPVLVSALASFIIGVTMLTIFGEVYREVR